jgi:hypothetical protein
MKLHIDLVLYVQNAKNLKAFIERKREGYFKFKMTERIDIEEKQERKPNHTRVTIHKTNRLSFTLLGLIAILWLILEKIILK